MAGVDEQGSNQKIQQTLANMKKNNQLLIGLDNIFRRFFFRKPSEQLQAKLCKKILEDITSAVEQQKPELTFETIIRKYIGVTYREDENEKKAHDIAGVIFYYLLKRETPDNAHHLLIILVNCTDLVLSITTTSRETVEGWSDLKWNETCSSILGNLNVFERFREYLASNSLSLESILNANSDLLLNNHAVMLIENASRILLDSSTLRNIFKHERDRKGRTVLLFRELTAKLSFNNIYEDNLEELFEWFSIKDEAGNTAFHNNTEDIGYLLMDTLTAGRTEKLYKLLSAQDNYGRTVLHFQTELIIDLLIKTPAAVNLDKLYNLLSVQDFGGDTVLHTEAGAVIDLLIKTRAAESLPQLYQLLLVKNNNGDTAFHCNTESICVLLRKTCTAENSDKIYKFLFIRDEYGQTVLHLKTKLIVNLLIEAYSEENIDQLYELLSVTDRRGKTVLHLETELIIDLLIETGAAKNSDKLYDLLSVEGVCGNTISHHKTKLIIDLLIKTGAAKNSDKLYQLLRVQDRFGKTALRFETELIIDLLIKTGAAKNSDKLYGLLSVKDRFTGETILHLKTKLIVDLLKKTGAAKNSDKLYHLLSVKDMHGKTVLHLKTNLIIYLLKKTGAAKNSDKLYQLLRVQDDFGNTVLHLNTKLVIHLLVKIYSPQDSEKLIQFINIKNKQDHIAPLTEDMRGLLVRSFDSNGDISDLYQLISNWFKDPVTFSEANYNRILELLIKFYSITKLDEHLGILRKIAAPQSSRLSDWLINQAENKCYLLYHEPTVLVFYTTSNRKGAEEEAQSIIDSFLSINYHNTKILRDKSKDKTLKLIKAAAGEAKSALIVVLMSHGTETGDSLQDSEGESIKFTEIESAMCEEKNLKDKPKVLIA